MTHSNIDTAANYLREGRLVSFPTETVYGLGANALSDVAVASIYEAKGRPQFNPLITHVKNMAMAFEYGVHSDMAEKLMQAFWPGSLTLILPRKKDCALSLLVSAGLDCIGLRMPDHPMARQLLEVADIPVAAPSANRSGHLSPTTAQHVQDELGDKVAMILDGGACPVGIESTVLDLSGKQPMILRHGSVTQAMIEKITGTLGKASDDVMKSPGMMQSHYAPDAAMRLNIADVREGEALLAFGKTTLTATRQRNLSAKGDLKEAAANLFSMLRELDKTGAECIAVMPIPMEGIGMAINDRLARAAAPKSSGA